MRLTWLGHSAFRIEIGSSKILIDPFLKGNPLFKQSFASVTKDITHILLTHGHDDHIGDAAEIGAKKSRNKSKPQIVSNYEICAYLAEKGADNMNPGNTGGTVDCGDFTVSFTDAKHSSGTVEKGKSIYLGNPNGLVIKAKGEKTLYHMGDTDIFSDLALIAELHKPQIVLIPIGDRFTMGADHAALALKRYLKPSYAIPIHYGTFPMLAPDARAFQKAMKGARTKIIVPDRGVPLDF